MVTQVDTEVGAADTGEAVRIWSVNGFRELLLGESLSRLGFQVVQFMLPLLTLTVAGGDAIEVGLVSGAQFLPVVLFSLVAGAWVDRFDLRRVLLVCNLVRGVVPGVIAVLFATDRLGLWAILAAAFVVGTATVCYDVGYQSAIPRTVPVPLIASANGSLQAVYAATAMAGPGLAGVLLQYIGAPLALSLTVVVFGASALALRRLREVPPLPEGTARTSTVTAVRTGLRFTLSYRPIRDLCSLAGLFNLQEQAFLTVFLVFAVQGLGLPTGTLGLVVGAGSLGALLGSLVAARIAARVAVGRLLLWGPAVAAAAFLLVPAGDAWRGAAVYLMIAGFFVNGAAMAVLNVSAVSLRQTIPPAHLLGSVTAAYRMVAFGTIPLGGLLGGLLAGALGEVPALWILGLSLLSSSVLVLLSPLRRLRTVAQAAELLGRQ